MLMARGVSVGVSRGGQNAVARAADAGCLDTLRFVLANGADPNAKDNEGTTPLMIASRNGLLEVVELLLESGADLEARDNSGSSAWLMAGLAGHLEIVELFKKVREEKGAIPK
jgi:ankyrin repeat protein